MLRFTRLVVTLALAASFTPIASAEIMYVYLTWQGDTSTTMTVNWQTREQGKKPAVGFGVESSDRPEGYPNSIPAATIRMENEGDVRFIHRAELTGLAPGAAVYFTAGDAKNGFSGPHKFKTVTAGDEPIRFVTGGDMDSTPITAALVKVAAAQEPAFVAIGGDIAYANNNPKLIGKWDSWFQTWTQNCTTPSGYMTPMVLAIGNHEAFGMFDQTPEDCNQYFDFFGQSPTSYFSRTFGKNFLLLVLDSSHATHHKDQVPWIDQQLSDHQAVPFKFAIYHVPLYSSVRPETGEFETRGRTYWQPLFDKYHLDTAFENHDHALKRTKLIKGDKEDPTGTLYLGDGCFGAEARPLINHPRWYMAAAQTAAHVWRVDVTKDDVTYVALGQNGEELDRATTPSQ